MDEPGRAIADTCLCGSWRVAIRALASTRTYPISRFWPEPGQRAMAVRCARRNEALYDASIRGGLP
jgi:hypothetical protein